MAIWIAKAIIQKTISFLPLKHQINFLFQKYVTKGVNLSDYLFEDKLTHLQNHISYFLKYSKGETSKFTALELGTGWYPIVPVGLYLAGADKIYTLDISSLLNEERILQTVERFIQYSEKDLGFKFLPERLEKLKEIVQQKNYSVAELLAAMNIVSLIVDARKIDLPDAGIDLINSNNTFEHIYPEILIDILKEFKRLAKPGAVMSHFIDMSDHFAHLDKSISVYNYLKFSEQQWNLIDNSIQPQNRMRLYEHEELYTKAGIPVTEKVIVGKGNDSIQSIDLDIRFKKYPIAETAITHASIISVM